MEAIADINIHYIRQKEPKGLGDAILCAKSFVGDEPFAVLLGDDVVYNDENPCLKQLIDVYNATGSSVLGCQPVPQEKFLLMALWQVKQRIMSASVKLMTW